MVIYLDNNHMANSYTKESKIIVLGINGLNLYDEEKDTFNRILEKENELPSQVYIFSKRGF